MGRADFARSIAYALAGWRGDQSVVVALHGPWGTGKSSIKNMALDAFTELEDADRPQVLEFNPWQFSGQDELFTAFFREIGAALGRDSGPDAAALERQWRVYEARLKFGSTVIDAINDLATTVLVLIGGAGVATALVGVNPSLGVGTISAVALAAGIFLKWPTIVARAFADLLRARASVVIGLPEVKKDLGEHLKKRSHPLVVILDDLDRLNQPDVRLMFQLIKANADLPRLVYFALFDEDIVAESLRTPAQDGREFLEKIVQVKFTVPVVQRAQVDKALFAGLDEILEAEGMSRTFEQVRWGNLYLGGLQQYFTTLRRVHRYLASLRFHVGVLRTRGALEVNVLDLIALEVLRLYEPSVYRQLPLAKRVLTEHAEREGMSGPKEGDAKATMKSVVAGVPAARTEALQRVLTDLFPHVGWVFGGTRYAVDDEQWLRDLRVATKRFFDRYFFLALPEGDVSEVELAQIIDAVGDRARLTTVLRMLVDRVLLAQALERLEAYKEQIPFVHAVPFAGAMLDIGDSIPPGAGGLVGIEPVMHASRILYWFLRQGASPQRGDRLLEAARTSIGFFLLAHRCQQEVDAHQKDKELALVTDEQLTELKTITIAKIEAAANDGRLLQHWGALRALYVWRNLAGEAIVKSWMTTGLTEPNVVAFLRATMETVTSHGLGDYVGSTRRFIKLATIEDFTPAARVEELLARVNGQTLSEPDAQALAAFREATARRRSGKPDYDPWRSDRHDDNS